MRLHRIAMLGAVALGFPGCLVNRQITEVVAQDEFNSYKVQTLSGYFAFFVGWQEWAAWNCYRTTAGFRCTEVDYEESKGGFKPVGALPPPAPAPPKAASVPPPTAASSSVPAPTVSPAVSSSPPPAVNSSPPPAASSPTRSEP